MTNSPPLSLVPIPELRHGIIQRSPNTACPSRTNLHCIYTSLIRHTIHYFNIMLCYKTNAKDVLICELYGITPIYNPFLVRVYIYIYTCVCVCVCDRQTDRERGKSVRSSAVCLITHFLYFLSF